MYQRYPSPLWQASCTLLLPYGRRRAGVMYAPSPLWQAQGRRHVRPFFMAGAGQAWERRSAVLRLLPPPATRGRLAGLVVAASWGLAVVAYATMAYNTHNEVSTAEQVTEALLVFMSITLGLSLTLSLTLGLSLTLSLTLGLSLTLTLSLSPGRACVSVRVAVAGGRSRREGRPGAAARLVAL